MNPLICALIQTHLCSHTSPPGEAEDVNTLSFFWFINIYTVYLGLFLYHFMFHCGINKNLPLIPRLNSAVAPDQQQQKWNPEGEQTRSTVKRLKHPRSADVVMLWPRQLPPEVVSCLTVVLALLLPTVLTLSFFTTTTIPEDIRTSAWPPGFSVLLQRSHFRQNLCQSLPKDETFSAAEREEREEPRVKK